MRGKACDFLEASLWQADVIGYYHPDGKVVRFKRKTQEYAVRLSRRPLVHYIDARKVHEDQDRLQPSLMRGGYAVLRSD